MCANINIYVGCLWVINDLYLDELTPIWNGKRDFVPQVVCGQLRALTVQGGWLW